MEGISSSSNQQHHHTEQPEPACKLIKWHSLLWVLLFVLKAVKQQQGQLSLSHRATDQAAPQRPELRQPQGSGKPHCLDTSQPPRLMLCKYTLTASLDLRPKILMLAHNTVWQYLSRQTLGYQELTSTETEPLINFKVAPCLIMCGGIVLSLF